MRTLLFLSAMFLFSFSCKTQEAIVDSNSSCIDSVILDEGMYSNGPKDDLTIMNASIENDCLLLTVGYGGGCEDLAFNLVASEKVMESFPVQMNIRVSFSDTDNCEALVTKELAFDLIPARLSDEEEVILRLEGWSTGLSYKY